jgi:hypothetical protein
MDDEIANFTAITSSSPEQAQRYLQLTDGNLEQAIQLYFEDPSLGAEPTATTNAATSRPSAGETAQNAIRIDSDNDSDVEMTSGTHDEDAEMARRLQAEMYQAQGGEEEDVSAPMARTRETLIGGPAGFDDMDDDAISNLVQQQILGRRARRESELVLLH